MGNCAGKAKQPAEEAMNFVANGPSVRLYGSISCPETNRLRIALHLKRIEIQFVESESTEIQSGAPVLQCGKETVTGSQETLLRYIESRFPNPRLFPLQRSQDLAIVAAVKLQHASITWHLVQMVSWADDVTTKRNCREGRLSDPCMETPRMQWRKFGRRYSRLLEVMQEHAQMEERVIFPVLEKADRGLCSTATSDHAKEFPMMNGVKEDIKSIGVLDIGSIAYHEAMHKLSVRLKILQEHCREHFEEEERDLLPFLEAADMGAEKQEMALGRCIEEVMEGSHSRLFRFLISGLPPESAMHYLDLVSRCCDLERASAMFGSLTSADGQW